MAIIVLAQIAALVVFYAVTGLGLGFWVGMAIGNIIIAREKSTLSEKHAESIRQAALHNAQWHPTHKKWHQK